MFLSHFDVFCDQFLDRRTATWDLLVEANKSVNEVIYASVLQQITRKNQSKYENNLTNYVQKERTYTRPIGNRPARLLKLYFT